MGSFRIWSVSVIIERGAVIKSVIMRQSAAVNVIIPKRAVRIMHYMPVMTAEKSVSPVICPAVRIVFGLAAVKAV